MERKVRRGMIVRSTSGISLGKVVNTGPQYFTVEKGVFFPKDHELRYDAIMELKGDEIVYQLSQEGAAMGIVEGAREKAWTKTELEEGKELRVPLMEEQLVVEKTTKEKGAVRIHKNVIEEQKQVTVPLRREEVIVEHIPGDRAATRATHPFEDERYAIPLHEEAFEVVKRPVVKEEVRVRRVVREEQRAASTTLRHEELEVEDDSRRIADIDMEKDKREL